MRPVSLTLLLIPLLSQLGFAQTAQTSPTDEISKARSAAVAKQRGTVFEVFKLQHVKSDEAVEMLRELVRGADLIPDMRMNAVLVNGTTEHQELVRKLVQFIDQPIEEAGNTISTTVFHLQTHVEQVYATLRVMMPEEVLIVADSRSNSIIATGSKSQLSEVESLIEALDVKPAVRKPLQLRVIWLSSDAEASTKVDDRLASVLKSLERVGISDLTKKAQLLVNVSEPSCDFSVGGSVGVNTEIQVLGQRIGDGKSPSRLDIKIQVKTERSPIEIEATVTISPDQMVVLGATPSSDSQSVFVVELIEGI